MSSEPSPAVKAARKAQARLALCLAEGRHFRLEAGAGAGKTYSLVEALKTIITEKGAALMHAGQQVACITYTEVARKEIANDIEEHPAILVNTIHGFAWAFISKFQKTLRELVANHVSRREAVEAAGGMHEQNVEYSYGFFGIDEKRITLHHDDVPRFFAEMLANEKFQRIFKSSYPILFIDEYQDTDPHVMNAFTEHFFKPAKGPVVGLFGDHWQTIYRRDYLLVDYPNVEGIDKGSNFRSVKPIVDVLNLLRPELKQEVDDEETTGEARFFHCNAFTGQREDSTHAKQELPREALAQSTERVKDQLKEDGWDFDPQRTKILMLTHSAIAAERGYPNLAKIFDSNEAFAKKEDATIAFLADMVEPVCVAYAAGNYGTMFNQIGGIPTIRKSADKAAWRADMDALLALRESGTIGQVIDYLKSTKRPRLRDRVAERESEIARLGDEATEDEPNSLKRHRKLRSVQYSELVELVDFVNGFTPFATQHSVKGAQFENVLVILSGGWNQYNWPRFLDYNTTGNIPAKDEAGYYRARNLLYVAVSRPQRRLAVLATQALSRNALATATRLFGQTNVIALPMEV
ncbi:UvrD-helicase domain-containing protein [Edaphobacter aggregans]|uniref:UvrD-helicase domain-containing protein n=1 Tax=Edaphobacter aggregans TaxID=570835 RepID=UPI0005505407|nr:UvrD-helicase domain-containing protein [Edaphobacter aggregans]